MPNSYSFAFIDKKNNLYTLGYNGYYNLGNNSTNYTTQMISKFSGKWKSISMNYHHSIGLLDDGTVVGAGYPSHYALSTDSGYYTQFTVLNNHKWKFAVAGYVCTVAIREDGTLWCWGTSSNYCIPYTSNTPYMLDSSNDWKSVSTGYYHNLAIKNDGSLWGWGYNSNGELGLGDYSGRYYPVRIGTDNDWKEVSAGGHSSMALKKDGTVWSWGYNNVGQLGLGNTTNQNKPKKVPITYEINSVSMGERHSLILDVNGFVYGAGEGANHRLGNGSTSNRSTYIKVNSPLLFSSISAQYATSYGITKDGKITSWGYGGHNQHFGTNTTYAYPTVWSKLGNEAKMLSDNSKYTGLKSLFYFNGKYHRWVERVESVDPNESTVPEMTSNTAPYGVASSSDGVAYYAFRNDSNRWYATDSKYPHYIQYKYENPLCIDKISIATEFISGTQSGLREFDFFGSNDGTSYTLLYSGTQANNTDMQWHSFTNNQKYLYYKLVGKSSYYSTRTYYIYIRNLQFYRKEEVATPEHWEVVSTQAPVYDEFMAKGQYVEDVVYQRDGLLPQEVSNRVLTNNRFSAYSRKINLKQHRHLNIESVLFETTKRI